MAVIREEGTNGDREMSAALFMAGFEVWDITVQDLLNEAVNIDQFRGLIFPGGFSYGGMVLKIYLLCRHIFSLLGLFASTVDFYSCLNNI